MSYYNISIICFCLVIIAVQASRPSTEDLNTLRLIQLVHTHGDRTPSHFVHNDPYSVVAHFWPEGIGQLTKLGRNRMYKVGRFFHKVYKNFLDTYRHQTNIESFIKVRSSSYRRCLESASVFVTGLISGLSNNTHKEKSIYSDLINYWLPIPIKSFSLKGLDPLLDVDFPCPNVDKTFHNKWRQDQRVKQAENENEKFFREISFYAGETINTLEDVNLLYQELYIETQSNYNWWKNPYQIWTKNYESYAINRLRELSQLYWTIFYDDPLIQRLIGGELIKELNNNIRNYVSGINRESKIFLYSTHDGKIVSILQAFGIYDTFLISPGATLIFELHELDSKSNDPFQDYYLEFYYYNETYSENGARKVFPEKFCHQQLDNHQICSLNQYLREVAQYEPSNIFYECGLEIHELGYKVNLSLVITNGILLAILILTLNVYAFVKIKKR